MKQIRLNTKLISNLSDVLFIQAAQIIVTTTIPGSTWYRITQTPECISIQQLLAIGNNLHIPVKRFFSCGKEDYIGRREEYITKTYTPCYYDNEALQEIVNSRSTATWSKAARKLGMSYSRLRNSLLAVTRTPVVRFLAVCDTFDIDPFTILIDPNPEFVKQSVTTSVKGAGRGDAKLLAEIGELTKKISELSETIQDLTQKYELLSTSYDELAHRISVDIENGDSNRIGMAAEEIK